MWSTRTLCVALLLAAVALNGRQGPGPPPDAAPVTVLRPARVFDGETLREGWAVRVRGQRIEAAGPAADVTVPGGTRIDLPGPCRKPYSTHPSATAVTRMTSALPLRRRA